VVNNNHEGNKMKKYKNTIVDEVLIGQFDVQIKGRFLPTKPKKQIKWEDLGLEHI
jgi:hypothetical protein